MNKENVFAKEEAAKQERIKLADALFDDYHTLETLLNYIDAMPSVQKLDNTEVRMRYYQVDKSMGTYHTLLQGILKRLDDAVFILGDDNEED